jgi:hypothetical protein
MTEAPAPRGRWSTIARQVGLGALVTAGALLLGAAIPLGPLLRDDYVLDGVVRAVALDVRDFGVDKGTERLRFELASQGLEDHVGLDDCSVEQGEQGIDVRCAWEVVLDVRIVERRVPIRFASHAHITPAGDLRG